MAKQMVLRKAQREALENLRNQVVKCLSEENALRKAYLKAAPLVRKAVETEYPPRDMRVLKKYGKAKVDDCIKLRLSYGAVQDVTFDFDDETGPLAVVMTYGGKWYLADDATTAAVTAWKTAKDDLDKTLQQKRRDYSTLINAARTLEEVETLWPEAAQIREAFKKNEVALLALTPTVIQRIKLDVAERVASK